MLKVGEYTTVMFIFEEATIFPLRSNTWEDDVTETLFKALGTGKECSLRWSLSSSIHPVL